MNFLIDGYLFRTSGENAMAAELLSVIQVGSQRSATSRRDNGKKYVREVRKV